MSIIYYIGLLCVIIVLGGGVMSIIYSIGLVCAIIAFGYFNYRDTVKKFESKNQEDYDETTNLEN